MYLIKIKIKTRLSGLVKLLRVFRCFMFKTMEFMYLGWFTHFNFKRDVNLENIPLIIKQVSPQKIMRVL